jgi:hypothetical protein
MFHSCAIDLAACGAIDLPAARKRASREKPAPFRLVPRLRGRHARLAHRRIAVEAVLSLLLRQYRVAAGVPGHTVRYARAGHAITNGAPPTVCASPKRTRAIVSGGPSPGRVCKIKGKLKQKCTTMRPFDPHPFDGAMAHRAAMSGSAEYVQRPAVSNQTPPEIPALQITRTVDDVGRVATANEWIAKNLRNGVSVERKVERKGNGR